MISVSVIDYRMGNTRSVVKTLHAMGYKAELTNDEANLNNASHLILPGVGAFPDGMANLREKLDSLDGKTLEAVLNEIVIHGRKPFLAICIGLQLLGDEGTEVKPEKGLGWIHGRVERFAVDETKYKVPHVGWDDVSVVRDSPLFRSVPREHPDFYFVHSYHLKAAPEDVVAYGEYGERYVAAVQSVEHPNVFGTQFHPEKSQANGVQVLRNFLSVR